MTSSQERRIGDRVAREIYRDPDYIDDTILMDYVQDVWQPLLTAARQRGELTPELDERFAFEVALGRDRSVNAFALPGGYLGLHLGLLAVVGSRDELASVLGHELSHITQRHIPRLIAKQNAQSPWLIGAMILGALAAAKNPNAAGALMVGGQAVAAQNQLNFSRDMEREADRVGFGVMTQAGFDPLGFVGMFNKLLQANRLTDSGAYPYLRSHPLTTERIADMQARLPAGPLVAAARPALDHAMLRARAEVLSQSDADALAAWPAKLAAPGFATLEALQQAGLLYGAALASTRQRDFAAARKDQQALAAMVALAAGDAAAQRQARLLGAEIALAAGDAGEVGRWLADSPLRRSEVLMLSQADLQLGGTAAATRSAERLQLWVASHPRDAQAWQWLSSARMALGQRLRAVRADAEAQWALMDLAGAQDRFKAGQDLARASAKDGNADHVEASIIDTRAREVALLLREQALER
jgi:predicted Zn-dependent protease